MYIAVLKKVERRPRDARGSRLPIPGTVWKKAVALTLHLREVVDGREGEEGSRVEMSSVPVGRV